jgi:hypothetical protein
MWAREVGQAVPDSKPSGAMAGRPSKVGEELIGLVRIILCPLESKVCADHRKLAFQADSSHAPARAVLSAICFQP